MKLEELINKNYNRLHENDFYILKYILNHRSTCYNLGINELAKECNVSRSSILRLAQKLDFSGYSEFRIFLKWEDQVEEVSNNHTGTFLSDIEASLKYVKPTNFDDICETLDNSRRIFVYGSGSAQTTCAYELQRMFAVSHRYLIVIHDNTEFELMLPNLTPDDAIIIISLSGDTPTLIPQARKLVARGVPLISITNLKNNLLAQLTPYNLYATSTVTKLDSGVDLVSFVPFFIVGEALFRHYLEYKEKKDTEEMPKEV